MDFLKELMQINEGTVKYHGVTLDQITSSRNDLEIELAAARANKNSKKVADLEKQIRELNDMYQHAFHRLRHAVER
jgi:hypothetical protein